MLAVRGVCFRFGSVFSRPSRFEDGLGAGGVRQIFYSFCGGGRASAGDTPLPAPLALPYRGRPVVGERGADATRRSRPLAVFTLVQFRVVVVFVFFRSVSCPCVAAPPKKEGRGRPAGALPHPSGVALVQRPFGHDQGLVQNARLHANSKRRAGSCLAALLLLLLGRRELDHVIDAEDGNGGLGGEPEALDLRAAAGNDAG